MTERYTVYGKTVTDELCEYHYECSTEKQATHLAGKLNKLEWAEECGKA